MPLKQQIREWQKLVASDQWVLLFEKMSGALDPQSLAASDLVALRSRYQDNYSKEMRGVITAAEARLALNQIREAVLNFMRQLEPKDLGSGIPLEDPMQERLAQLNLRHPLTPLHIVNCDRRKMNRKFRKAFRQWDEQRNYQFYFALGCPTQEPDGFAERMVFELIAARLMDHHNSIDYPRHPEGERLKIANLPIGFTLRDCQAQFQKYMAERFQMGNLTLENFLKQELPQRQESYIAMPFSILASEWDIDLMEEYLPWILKTFAARPRKGPTCLFVFVVKLRSAHRPEEIRFEREVLDSLNEIIAQHQEEAVLLAPFGEVPQYYLEEWFERIAEVRKDEVDDIINHEIIQKLSEKELKYYQTEDQLINMERISALLEKIWNIHRNNL